MASDILMNKVTIIERCLSRIREVYIGNESELETNYTYQDSIILNLQRACEASIDAAMHIVRLKKLGIPQDSRDAFAMICDAGVIDRRLSDQLMAMVGFRNIAVHDYRKLNIEIIESILNNNLDDFKSFSTAILAFTVHETD